MAFSCCSLVVGGNNKATTTSFAALLLLFVAVLTLITTTCTTAAAMSIQPTKSSSTSSTTTTTTTRTPTGPHLLCVGLAAIDFVATCDHFPQPDEKMRSISLQIEGGGNAANTACAMARFIAAAPNYYGIASSSLVTAVGDDVNGNTILQGLQDDMHVNIDHVERYAGNSPFSYILSTTSTTSSTSTSISSTTTDVDDKNNNNKKKKKKKHENTRTIIHQPSSGDMSMEFVQNIPLLQVLPDEDNNDKDNNNNNSRPCRYRPLYTAVHFDARYPTAAVALAKRCCGGITDEKAPKNNTTTTAVATTTTTTNTIRIPYSVDVERPREGLLELLQHASVVICASTYCRGIVNNNNNNSKNKLVDLKKEKQNNNNNNNKKEDNADNPAAVDADNNPADLLRQVMNQQAPNAILAIQTLGSQGSCLIRLGPEYEMDPMKDGVVLPEDDDNNNDNHNNNNNNDNPVVTVKDNVMYCPSFSGIHVVDTTGAGDAFQGGFLAALWTFAYHSGGGDPNNPVVEVPTDPRVLAHCLRIGTRVAAKKVEQTGARRGLPFAAKDAFIKSEMEALLKLAKKKKNNSNKVVA